MFLIILVFVLSEVCISSLKLKTLSDVKALRRNHVQIQYLSIHKTCERNYLFLLFLFLQPTGELKYCSRPGDCAAQVECCVKSRERPGVRYCSTMLELDDVCTPVLIVSIITSVFHETV